MRIRALVPALIALPLLAHGQLKRLDDFQAAAQKAHCVLTLAALPHTPASVSGQVDTAIAEANGILDTIAHQPPDHRTFASTFVALDDATYRIKLAQNAVSFAKEISTDSATRAAAAEAVKRCGRWAVDAQYRVDLYQVLTAFAVTRPELLGEDARLVEETMRDYRRAGMQLSLDKRNQLQRLRGELSSLLADFDNNIVNAKAPVTFHRAELGGVPQSLLDAPGVKTGDDSYTIATNVMWQFNAVAQNARNAATRRRAYVARESMAKDQNVSLLNRILTLRNNIALTLGYRSWADFQLEIRMANSAGRAESFIDGLIAGLQPKFSSELHELEKLKTAESGEKHPRINTWDWRYFTHKLTNEKYAVDEDQLRSFFPFEQTLQGMLAIYARIFRLHFDEVALPQKWTDELRLFVTSDAVTGEPLGLCYFDLFAREGKENVGGTYDLVEGKLLRDGSYQRPAVAVLLNFTPPTRAQPLLLSHHEVEALLFHEFGHALHSMLTRAKYHRFAGTNVPADFVEAPSQMLQNWAWDKSVLDTFAADYRDSSRKIPADLIAKLKQAKLATSGIFYRRQCAFAKMDLALHGEHKMDEPYDCAAISNPILDKVFLAIEPTTALVASFRGINGYDAGYYGYAWSEALGADMASAFQHAPDGYLDVPTGLRLRREIYEPGNSRAVDVSIEKFLGRKWSFEPFLQQIGAVTTDNHGLFVR